MYEKLISSLRICQGMCEGSRFEEAAKLLTQAADAIEGLSGLVDRYGGETGIKNLQEYANKYWDLLKNAPRWIPVTERVPEPELYLVRCNEVHKHIYRIAYCYNSVWYEDSNDITEFVTHWISLPEPPKEET